MTDFNAQDSQIQTPGLQVNAAPVSTVAMPGQARSNTGIFSALAEGLGHFSQQFDKLAESKSEIQIQQDVEKGQALTNSTQGAVDPRPGFGPNDSVFFKEGAYHAYATAQATRAAQDYSQAVEGIATGDKDALMAAKPAEMADQMFQKTIQGLGNDPAMINAIAPAMLRARNAGVQKIALAQQKEDAVRKHEQAYQQLGATYQGSDFAPEQFTANVAQMRASGMTDNQVLDATSDFVRVYGLTGKGDPRLIKWAHDGDMGNGLSLVQMAAKVGNDKVVKEFNEMYEKSDALSQKVIADGRAQASAVSENNWLHKTLIAPDVTTTHSFQDVTDAINASTELTEEAKGKIHTKAEEVYKGANDKAFRTDAVAHGMFGAMPQDQKLAFSADLFTDLRKAIATGTATPATYQAYVGQLISSTKSDGSFKSPDLEGLVGDPPTETYNVTKDANGNSQLPPLADAKWGVMLALAENKNPDGSKGDGTGPAMLQRHLKTDEARSFVMDVKAKRDAGTVNIADAIAEVRKDRESMTPQIVEANKAATHRILSDEDLLFRPDSLFDFSGLSQKTLNGVRAGGFMHVGDTLPPANKAFMKRDFAQTYAKQDSRRQFTSDEAKVDDFKQNTFEPRYLPVKPPGGTAFYVKVPVGRPTNDDASDDYASMTLAVQQQAAAMKMPNAKNLILEAVDPEASEFRVVDANTGDRVTGFKNVTDADVTKFGAAVRTQGQVARANAGNDASWGTGWYAKRQAEHDAKDKVISALAVTGKTLAANNMAADQALPPVNMTDLKHRTLPALSADTVRESLPTNPAFALTASLEGYKAAIGPDNEGRTIGYGYNVDKQSATLDADFQAANIADKAKVLSGASQITEPQARALYQQVANRNQQALSAEVAHQGGKWSDLPPNRQAALMHLAYNGGPGNSLVKKAVSLVLSNKIDDLKDLPWGYNTTDAPAPPGTPGGNIPPIPPELQKLYQAPPPGGGKTTFHRNTQVTDAVWAMARGTKEFEHTLH